MESNANPYKGVINQIEFTAFERELLQVVRQSQWELGSIRTLIIDQNEKIDRLSNQVTNVSARITRLENTLKDCTVPWIGHRVENGENVQIGRKFLIEDIERESRIAEGLTRLSDPK